MSMQSLLNSRGQRTPQAAQTGCPVTMLSLLFANFVTHDLDRVPAFASPPLRLASMAGFGCTRQALRLGVIGEHLARIHFPTMNRLTYAIRETAGRENSDTQNPR
jgi:undecaprenyl-phosphate 4-deoxy-4-formamido-L-arabinose transferase